LKSRFEGSEKGWVDLGGGFGDPVCGVKEVEIKSERVGEEGEAEGGRDEPLNCSFDQEAGPSPVEGVAVWATRNTGRKARVSSRVFRRLKGVIQLLWM